MTFDRLTPGQTTLKADSENAVKAAVEALLNMTGADMVRTGTGFHFRRRPTPPAAFHVTVNSPLTAPGCYDGFLVEYDTDPIDTSSSSPPSLGNGVEEIVVFNTIDIELTGGSGHILTDGTSNLFTFPAQRWLPRTTTDGKRIAVISAVDYKICPP